MSRVSRSGTLGAAAAAAVAALAARDLIQRDHALLRNFPVLGHARYLLEAIGPELRQYIVAGNNEERPFTRDQRRWVYASAKKQNNYFGFGTDNDIEYTARLPDHQAPHVRPGRAAVVTRPPGTTCGCPARRCSARPGDGARAFRPESVVNISGDELRLALRQRHRRAQQGRGARRLPAEHR